MFNLLMIMDPVDMHFRHLHILWLMRLESRR